MSSAQDRIADILNLHRFIPAELLADVCSCGEWKGAFREGHAAHQAAVIADDLGLNR